MAITATVCCSLLYSLLLSGDASLASKVPPSTFMSLYVALVDWNWNPEETLFSTFSK